MIIFSSAENLANCDFVGIVSGSFFNFASLVSLDLVGGPELLAFSTIFSCDEFFVVEEMEISFDDLTGSSLTGCATACIGASAFSVGDV